MKEKTELFEYCQANTDKMIPVILKYKSSLKVNKKDRETKVLFEDAFQSKADDAFKVSIINGFINFDYYELIRDQQKETKQVIEEEATVKKAPWYENLTKTGSICKHKEKADIYLYILVNPQIKTESAYFLNESTVIEKSKLKNFLPVPKDEANFIDVRRISLDHIVEVEFLDKAFK